jgi:protein involved in polysaccharide export with SLBB domain
VKNKYLLCILVILLACFGLPLFAQEDDQVTTQQASNAEADLEASSVDASRNIMLARSSSDYRVTPGDVYTLAYAIGSNSISYTITVDSSYRIRVSNLGIINGAGKTFMQLKNEVEAVVTNNYPLSGVQLVLTQPAIFRVYVNGEVSRAGESSAWALSRLSSLTTRNTAYTSIRDISIKSSNGQTKVYDLFKAQRNGDLSQDPYLRPGDIVTFNRINRIVTINGSVERPGRYQLLAGEKLKDLINVYANGFTPTADKTRITLVRYVDSAEISGDRIVLSEQDLARDYDLQHLDVISIPAITSLRPAVPVNRIERTITIHGAVRRPGTYELMSNENLKELIEVYADGLTVLADKTRATLTRYVDSIEISGDITLLSEQDLTGNYVLQHLDVITIPPITELRPAVRLNRIERTITINGAVRRPGTYELMPNENLKELIDVYADGLTPVADRTRATLARHVESAEISGDIVLLSEQELAGNYPLQHLDVITVPDITELRPAVYVNRVERTITINGAVRRPGTYELMPNENLKELIEVYAGEFTALADPSRMELLRLVNSVDIAGDRIFLASSDVENNYRLEHYDVITVPNITQLQPVMFVEGAVRETRQALGDMGTSTSQEELTSSTRLVVQFVAGETYASLVRRNVSWFTAVSDTQNAYILRRNERLPININPMLYDASYRDEVLVVEDDILIIPFRQYFVTVSGAVYAPGRYPYIPDRDWEYYVALAGGFIPGRNGNDAVTIIDIHGKRLKKTDTITPETNITAKSNHFMYYFNQFAPVVTTVFSIFTTILTVVIMTR